jgi:hypothetical protein
MKTQPTIIIIIILYFANTLVQGGAASNICLSNN